MDADAALLDRVAAAGETAYVRIYRWAEPTVTLGYFQSFDETLPAHLKPCPRVRRLTGGGAILHHHEITYSCILPSAHPISRSPVDLYKIVHNAIIELLAKCGAEAQLRGEQNSDGVEPWLCFLRKDPRDVVVKDHKVIGSAQRRRRGNILQHGSVLLRTSPLTPNISGLEDLYPRMDTEQFCRRIGEVLLSALAR